MGVQPSIDNLLRLEAELRGVKALRRELLKSLRIDEGVVKRRLRRASYAAFLLREVILYAKERGVDWREVLRKT